MVLNTKLLRYSKKKIPCKSQLPLSNLTPFPVSLMTTNNAEIAGVNCKLANARLAAQQNQWVIFAVECLGMNQKLFP